MMQLNQVQLNNKQQIEYILINQTSNMFKQSKKQFQSENIQTSSCYSKSVKTPQNISKQLLQFLARQFIILKDIAETCSSNHTEITASRLKQCVHLLQKKLNFSLTNNPQQYHDYIQDFYENQINNLRLQLNQQKINFRTIKRQLQEIKNSYDMIIKQKQSLMQHNLETSRLCKNNMGLQYIQQNRKLKKQLEHCKILLQQNTKFIEQQQKAIQQSSSEMQIKQKQYKKLIQNMQQKVLHFDQYVNNYHKQGQKQIKNLKNQHKLYQTQLKQLIFTKTRIIQEKANLQKQLQIKVSQIQLLTKKILEDQIIMGKLQKNLAFKQKVIHQLYQQIDSVNASLTRFAKKQEDFQKLSSQNNQQIIKLEERIKNINQSNQKLQRKVNQLTKKVQQFNKLNISLQKQLHQNNESIHKIQKQYQILQRKYQRNQKIQIKLNKQKQKYQKQIKLLDQHYQQLYQKNKQQKQTVKKQIIGQVNQLIALVQQKQAQVKQLIKQKQQLTKQLNNQREDKNKIQNNYVKMGQILSQIQRKIQFLQNQNCTLNQAKLLIEEQLQKYIKQSQKLIKLQKQYCNVLNQKNNLVEQLQKLKKNSTELLSYHNSIKQQQKKQIEMEQIFVAQRKQYKQLINKKDFQLKQLQCKTKILQEELRDSSKLFQNEKIKLNLKIKQLEQLLKQRYDFSSRFSQLSDNVY